MITYTFFQVPVCYQSADSLFSVFLNSPETSVYSQPYVAGFIVLEENMLIKKKKSKVT